MYYSTKKTYSLLITISYYVIINFIGYLYEKEEELKENENKH